MAAGLSCNLLLLGLLADQGGAETAKDSSEEVEDILEKLEAQRKRMPANLHKDLSRTDNDWHARGGLPPPKEQLLYQRNCGGPDGAVAQYRDAPVVGSSPPRHMPAPLAMAYTMNGEIAYADMFVDDTIGGKGSHYSFPQA